MADYNLYVIDPFDLARPLPALTTKLAEWFDAIVRQAGYSRVYVCNPQYEVRPAPHELLIYVCPFGTSVVQKMPGAQKDSWPSLTGSTHHGVTEIRAVTGSEVWVKTSDIEVLAALIFHEAMHNKLQLGQALHTQFNPRSLSSASITLPASPTAPEVSAMAAALKKPVQQWADGQRLLRQALRQRIVGDDSWDISIAAV